MGLRMVPAGNIRVRALIISKPPIADIHEAKLIVEHGDRRPAAMNHLYLVSVPLQNLLLRYRVNRLIFYQEEVQMFVSHR